jgi:hypothetical protein
MSAAAGYALAAGGSFFSSLFGNSSKLKEIKERNYQTARDNDAVVKSNLENTIRTGFRVGLLNLQLGQSRKEVIQSGFDTTVAGKAALGASSANAAAANAIGSSVDIVQNDINQRLGEADAMLDEDWDLIRQNFNIDLEGTVMQGKDALQGAVGSVYKTPSTGSMLMSAGLSALGSFAGNYATRSMSLGLGTPATRTPFKLSSDRAVRGFMSNERLA